jgi:uncharacterized membrane protein YkvA (DUF1232 family)
MTGSLCLTLGLGKSCGTAQAGPVEALREWFDVPRIGKLKRELSYYRALAIHPHVPRLSKWLLAGAIAYLLSPIDLIPDFIPVVGYLDDLVIVPGMIWFALTLVPREIKAGIRRDLAECQ